MSIEITYFENRKDWRKWLTDNFETANEIWFVFPYKSSGKKSITYNDAVEDALCFEGIDTTINSLDNEHKLQRFTPRNPKSAYSQAVAMISPIQVLFYLFFQQVFLTSNAGL
jgi:uncharacterized protein YdeI (YjbR/CyaY-like superfamily)